MFNYLEIKHNKHFHWDGETSSGVHRTLEHIAEAFIINLKWMKFHDILLNYVCNVNGNNLWHITNYINHTYNQTYSTNKQDCADCIFISDSRFIGQLDERLQNEFTKNLFQVIKSVQT